MSIHGSDIEGVSEVTTEPVAHGRSAEPVVALLVALLITIISIAVQQMIFYRFVQEVGGRPDGLFETSRGAYYELWSLTGPLWITNAVMLLVGITWAVRFHRLGFRWLTIALWIAYVAILWSLTVASSGLVQILGKGEVFI